MLPVWAFTVGDRARDFANGASLVTFNPDRIDMVSLATGQLPLEVGCGTFAIRVGDYEGTPSKWDWSAAIPKAALKTKLSKTRSRLISVHRPNGDADVPFAAVWIANKGADKTNWDWSPGTTGSDLDALVTKAKGRLIHVDAFTLTGKGVRFAGIWVENTGELRACTGAGTRR